MRTKDNTKLQKKRMVDAMEKTLGIVTSACKIVDIPRSLHYLWMTTDPEYKKQIDELSDMVLDFAESQLHKQIKEGNTTATIFYLKTKGKKRDYIERTEIKHDGGLELSGKMSEESKHKIAQILENEY
jgi:hypothetical protein